MSLPVLVALAAVLVAALARWRAEHGRIDLDGLVLAPTLAMLLVGIAATLLALVRGLSAGNLALVSAGLALAVWPWRRTPPRPTAAGLTTLTIGALALSMLGAVALRAPAHDYALAGRDQGTYTLRAEAMARTGALDLHDPLLESASRLAKRRSGPGDILGLLPTSGERWRKDRYEGAYRPGLYLADRHRGHVVPQLFHLHPALLACGVLAVGSWGPGALTICIAAIGLLALAAVGARVWPRGPWLLLPVALVGVSPLMIWVQRSALSEGPAMLLLWAAVLAALRARDGEPHGLPMAALLLGGGAWVRGHGLLVAPAVAVALLALPVGHRRSAGIFGALVLGSLMVHAATAYPYLHDEIARMAPTVHPGPGQLVAVGLALALAWDGAHRLRSVAGRRSTASRNALSRAPLLLVSTVAFAVVWWLVLRIGAPPKPFARLDPLPVLVSPLVLVAATAGALGWARARLPSDGPHVWLTAIGAAMAVPIVLYARRNLPQGGLYYYGRYLAPEVVPLLAFAATDVVRRLHGAFVAPSRGRAVSGVAAILLIGATAWPLATDPATRIREFAGARRFVETLADAVPPGSVVIAGGEGWHHGHTFNQVGGALALSHGISVLPYRSVEAAYATLHEMLVEAPQPGRPVFLLINEATKPYRLRDDDGKATGTKLAALDDLVFPPFKVTDVRMLEMFVHRLTPVTDSVPTRVTRDELRMALLHVEVDATLEARVERFAPPGGTDPRCLHRKKKTKIKLPKSGVAGDGPVALVLVASPGTSRSNETWHIKADKTKLRMNVVGAPSRPRDTLGPFILSKRPRKLTVRGAKRKHRKAPCPHGGIDEIRIIPLPGGIDGGTNVTAESLGPPLDLGHPVEPITWVAGRGLSRARPGIVSKGGDLVAKGPSLLLVAGQSLTWKRQPLPERGEVPLAVVLTLGRSNAGESASLQLRVDGEVVATIEPPPQRSGSWQSEPIAIDPSGPLASFSVSLQAEPGADVWVRDLGVFSRAAGRPSVLR